MNWDPEKIKVLRLRLGWSRSDLARRLQCEYQTVNLWENGAELPKLEFIQALDLLAKQADSSADEISSLSVAEVLLEEEQLAQIEITSCEWPTVRQRFKANN